MPTYDYRCVATGDVYEARHGINDRLHTWAQLCDRLGMDVGQTPPETALQRLATGGAVVKSSSLKNPEAPPCASGGGCCGGGGMCGF